MRILTLNPGSSSLKAALVEDGTAVGWAASQLTEPRLVSDAVHRWARPDAVAVRFVHGGSHTEPELVTDALLANLERLAPLAPLHQPQSLAVTCSPRPSAAATRAICWPGARRRPS